MTHANYLTHEAPCATQQVPKSASEAKAMERLNRSMDTMKFNQSNTDAGTSAGKSSSPSSKQANDLRVVRRASAGGSSGSSGVMGGGSGGVSGGGDVGSGAHVRALNCICIVPGAPCTCGAAGIPERPAAKTSGPLTGLEHLGTEAQDTSSMRTRIAARGAKGSRSASTPPAPVRRGSGSAYGSGSGSGGNASATGGYGRDPPRPPAARGSPGVNGSRNRSRSQKPSVPKQRRGSSGGSRGGNGGSGDSKEDALEEAVSIGSLASIPLPIHKPTILSCHHPHRHHNHNHHDPCHTPGDA